MAAIVGQFIGKHRNIDLFYLLDPEFVNVESAQNRFHGIDSACQAGNPFLGSAQIYGKHFFRRYIFCFIG
jgi:hypothetical protein